MLKRLSAALLFGGLLLGLTPTGAGAAPLRPAGVTYGPSDHRDDHYRCMYHCDERYGSGWHDGYDRDRYRYRYRRYCWYHDQWGWYRARCYDHHGYGGGGSYSRDHGGDDSAHAGGGYDSHREHSGG